MYIYIYIYDTPNSANFLSGVEGAARGRGGAADRAAWIDANNNNTNTTTNNNNKTSDRNSDASNNNID